MNVTIKKPEEPNQASPGRSELKQRSAPTVERRLSLPEPIKYFISVLILVAGVGTAIGMSFLKEANTKIDSDALIPTVDTVPVSNFQGNLDLLASGTVVPYREIQVGAQVSGTIERKYPECEAGMFVNKGTPLIEIDPADYQLEIKTVNSEILQAERTIEETEQDIRGAIKNLEIAQTNLKIQKSEYQRKLKLKSSLSPAEMNSAKQILLESESQATTRQNTYDSLLARRESLKASLELNKTRLQRAELNLERATVVAPVDGVIVRESVEQGDFTAVGSPLFVIEDTSKCEIVCNLTPGELSWLRTYSSQANNKESHFGVYELPKVDIEVFERGNPQVVWSGVLERFDGIGRNMTTKSIPCRILVNKPVTQSDNKNHVLVRGMFVQCRAVLSTSAGLDLAAIPLVAIRPGDYVWVVRDDELKKIDVEVVDRTPFENQRVQDQLDKVVAVKLINGLNLGDAVITSPLPQPVEGGRVIPKEPVTSSVSEINPDTTARDSGSRKNSESSSDAGPGSPTASSKNDEIKNESERSQP